jgi:hypothetical protein
MPSKVVIDNAVLKGSRDEQFLQRVATVYVGGEEYRILAPPKATARKSWLRMALSIQSFNRSWKSWSAANSTPTFGDKA